MKRKAAAALLILLAVFFLGCSDPYRIFSQNEEQTVLILPGEESAAAMAPPAVSSGEEESEQGQIVYYVKGSEIYHTDRSCTFLQKVKRCKAARCAGRSLPAQSENAAAAPESNIFLPPTHIECAGGIFYAAKKKEGISLCGGDLPHG